MSEIVKPSASNEDSQTKSEDVNVLDLTSYALNGKKFSEISSKLLSIVGNLNLDGKTDFPCEEFADKVGKIR